MSDEITLATPIEAPVPDLTAGQIAAHFRGGAYNDATVGEFAAVLVEETADAELRTSVLAAQIAHETRRFRYGGQVRPEQFNFAGIGSTNDGAVGTCWATVRDGVRAVVAHHGNYLYGPFDRWPARMLPYQRYAVRNRQVLAAGHGGKVRVVGDYLNGRWAYSPDKPPLTLDNGYARAIVRIANELRALSAGEERPTMQIQLHLTPHNHVKGRGGQRVEAVVWHVAEGLRGGVRSWFANIGSQASTQYMVNKDGTIDQYVREEDTAWANGKVTTWNRGNAWLASVMARGINPNQVTIAIETEGYTQEDLTPPQEASLIALTREIFARHGIPRHEDRILGHNEVDGVGRARCPGFSPAEWGRLLDGVLGDAAPAPAPAPVVRPQPADVWEVGGVQVGGLFLNFYRGHPDGLTVFGLPVTGEIAEGGRTVQYFERARFELASATEVQLGRVGAELLEARGAA